MKRTNIFLIVFIFCFVFSISSVAASDANDTAIANDIADNKDIQTISNDENTQQILQSNESGDEEIIKEPTKISVKSVTGKEKSKVKIKATVKTSSNTPVAGVKVTFKVDGKTYTGKTNANGVASITIKIPKTKILKVTAKTKNNMVTKTTEYKKTYNCVASLEGNDNYESSSTKFKVISKKTKKVQKYKIIKKQVKTITIPYKYLGLKKKTSGQYLFGILHEQQEGNRLSIIVGNKLVDKLIKFSSKVFYKANGKKVYIPNNKWLKSKRSTDVHEYYYNGYAKMYVTIKYTANTYKKI